MKYYIAVGNKPQWPYDVNELLAQGVTENTLVWNESMTGWKPAKDVDEIARILNPQTAVPPPYSRQEPAISCQPSTYPQTPNTKCPKTYLVHAILCTIFCNLILGIIGIIMALQVESRWREGRYDEALKKSHNAKLFVILSFIVGLLASSYSGYYFFNNPTANPFLF